jgi:hypothetical protein
MINKWLERQLYSIVRIQGKPVDPDELQTRMPRDCREFRSHSVHAHKEAV